LEREPQSTRLFMRLAHHYHHAKCSEKSQHYNALAAEEALSVFAYSDAAELLERGIDGRSLDDATYSLYGKLAEAYLYAQRPADSVRITQELFDFAVARGRLREAATFGFELSRRRYQLLDDEGSIETIRRAIAVADACADPDIAFDLHATHAWYLAQLRRVDEAAQALAQAEPLRPHGAPHGLVRYYEARGVRSVHAGERETYREDLDEALRIAQGEGVRFYIRRLDTALAIAMASNLDDTEYALEMCRRMWDAAATQPMHTVAPMLSTTALVALLVGELETAKHIIAASLQSAEEAPLIHFNIARAGIPLAIHLDDPLLLRRCSRPRLLENAFASNTENVFGPVAAAVAQHLRVQNRTSEAVALVTHTIKRLATLANNIPIAVEAARLGAQEALERAMPMLDAMRNASRSADAGRHLASAYVSNGQERRQHAERAAELFHAIGWVFYEAEALEMAAKPEQALAIYRRCGSIANVRRLESTQKARAAAGLSKREWEVAQLVAQGRSNRAIAGELYLSERTVENHIASIFNKLSLRSRAEIATYVAREGAKAEEQR
jgi:DNA-binding NarL/FixJ family response regulator